MRVVDLLVLLTLASCEGEVSGTERRPGGGSAGVPMSGRSSGCLAAILALAAAACGGKTTVTLPAPGSPACASSFGMCVMCSDDKWRCAGQDDAGIEPCTAGDRPCSSSARCVSCTGGTGVVCNDVLNPGGDNDVEVTMTTVTCTP